MALNYTIQNPSQLKGFFRTLYNVEVSAQKRKESDANNPDWDVRPQKVVFAPAFIDWLTEKRLIPVRFTGTSPEWVRLTQSSWQTVVNHASQHHHDNDALWPLFEATKPKKGGQNTPKTGAAGTAAAASTSTAMAHYQQVRALIDAKGAERAAYTEDELALLASYEGAGGLAKEMSGHATDPGILNQFYTPEKLAVRLWNMAYAHGLPPDGLVLEPACGTGRLLPYHNPALVDAYETDQYAYTICRVLHPEVQLQHAAFESAFFDLRVAQHLHPQPKYHLVIGNPPYGKFLGSYAPFLKERYLQAVNASRITYEQFFIWQALSLTLPGGLVVMVVPSALLHNSQLYNPLKAAIARVADIAVLEDLPSGLFANTNYNTAILALKKRPEWKP